MKKGVKFLNENAADIRVSAWNLHEEPSAKQAQPYY